MLGETQTKIIAEYHLTRARMATTKQVRDNPQLLLLGATYRVGCFPLGTMATLRPLMKAKIIKKRTGSSSGTRHVNIKHNWQKPRGIDNRVKRRFNGQILMLNIGYGSNKKTKHMLPSGSQKFLVHHVKELKCC